METNFQVLTGKETTCHDSFSVCRAQGSCYPWFAMPSAGGIPRVPRDGGDMVYGDNYSEKFCFGTS